MALREIIKKGDPVLEKHCHPVTRFDQKLWDLLDDMRETLAQANGLGLAAPQVGILRRAVLVVNDQEEMLELINPEIIASEGGGGRPGGLPLRARLLGLCEASRMGEGPGPRPERK